MIYSCSVCYNVDIHRGERKMSFIYLFEKVDFDKDGNVCETKTCNINKARSNFLYLVSKYNQQLLQQNELSIPAFFKEDLASLLQKVEGGYDFSKAKKVVFENCIPQVQKLAKDSKSDKETISKLNETVYIKDADVVSDLKKADNQKHREYILTSISGKLFENVFAQMMKSDIEADKKAKSNLYKDIIKYNSLVLEADKVKENDVKLDNSKKLVG